MNKLERQSLILDLFGEKDYIEISDVKEVLSTELGDLMNDFNELEDDGKIEEISKGKYKLKQDIKEYFSISSAIRPQKTYNKNLLLSYIPNQSSFLGKKYEMIKKEYIDFNNPIKYLDKENQKIIDNIIVDLSFASSKIEGNTYTYLETETLVKYDSPAEFKKPTDSKMIINHKNAIKYIIDNIETIDLSQKTFKKIHTLLCEDLLSSEFLGEIRVYETHINESAYYPLDNMYQLESEYENFIKKLNDIKNPFEQSIFILTFIPYLSVFTQMNNRTSRVCAIIPLIKKGLIPLTFLQIKDSDYMLAMLAIFELNDTIPLKKLFVENFLLNFKRYT